MPDHNTIAILFAACLPLAAYAESYTIDSTHTYAHFSINRQGFSTMHGRFDRSSGKLTLDRAARNGAVDIAIETASISTGFSSRDEHLRSSAFFNAEKFPVITYKSSSVKFKDDEPVSVEGNLTMNGVTRPVTITVEAFKCGIHPWSRREACGADASAQIKRSDFNIKYGLPGISDDIKLVFEVEANKD